MEHRDLVQALRENRGSIASGGAHQSYACA
jgi:hypothetical protein